MLASVCRRRTTTWTGKVAIGLECDDHDAAQQAAATAPEHIDSAPEAARPRPHLST